MKKLLPIAVVIVAMGLVYSGCDSADNIDGESSDAVSRKLYIADQNNVVTDDDIGLQVEKNVLHITFSQMVDETEVKEIVEKIGGKIVGFDLDTNFYQVKFPGADLKKTKGISVQLLKEYKEVEIAVLNTVSKHDNPYWDET